MFACGFVLSGVLSMSHLICNSVVQGRRHNAPYMDNYAIDVRSVILTTFGSSPRKSAFEPVEWVKLAETYTLV